jgi:peptidoglycan/xylan/chitin deacetylase (PgdA/CDA1 family)
MSKPVLTIHEMHDKILLLPLENYILTFDDGLYSQYFYYDKIKHIPTEKIFFISSGIICEGTQSTEFPSCEIAHKKAFAGNYEDYMTVDQIKELMQDPLVTIGGHSHLHQSLNLLTSKTDKIKHIISDTKKMLEWFHRSLTTQPTSFCFPYNDNCNGLYQRLLATEGFTNFYGNERIDIQNLYSNLVISG